MLFALGLVNEDWRFSKDKSNFLKVMSLWLYSF